MDNTGRSPDGDDALDALRTLSDICREEADRHGGDFTATWEGVRRRVERLPAADRAGLDTMLRDILRFEPPPSRSSQ